MKNAFDINICGYKENSKTYECPAVCSECNQCHQSENQIHLKYNSLCGRAKTLEDKEKCNMYKDRIVLSKKLVFIIKRIIIKIIIVIYLLKTIKKIILV